MYRQGEKNDFSQRTGIIRTVRTPLGFFVLVVLVVEAILGSVAYSGNRPDSTYALAGMLGILILLVTVVALMAYYRPEALRGARAPDSPVRAAVVYPPTEKDRYHRLFGGFSDCDFFAFNPPFEVEYSGEKIHEESLGVHKERYESRVKSRYLFFDKRSYENGERFFDVLSRHIGREEVDRNIKRVYRGNAAESPGYTFFIGYKNGTSAIVLYPRAVMENGIPRAVIYIEGAEGLMSILREFFLKQWSGSRGSSTCD